jgi:hypothetical protein
MPTNQSVRPPATQVVGGFGIEPWESSGLDLDGVHSPSFLPYLSAHQACGLGVFLDVHFGCPLPNVGLTWDESLTRLLEVAVYCPECCVSRTYMREGR